SRHVPAVHGHPVRRPGGPAAAGDDGRAAACRRRLVFLRAGPDADAVGGAIRAARRPRPGGSGGQPVSQQGGEGDQRSAGGAREDHHRVDGRLRGHTRRRPRDPRPTGRDAAVSAGPAALSPWRELVRDEWIDYNGHLSEAYYVLVFGHATDSVMEQVGLGPDYRAAQGASLYTVEAHV